MRSHFLPFVKMHAMGNDFIILRDSPVPLSPALIRKMAHRRGGIGCDQVLMISQKTPSSPFVLNIWNADGSFAQACGNGTRCAVWLVAQDRQPQDKMDSSPVFFETAAGVLEGRVTAPFEVEATQGFPRWTWSDIPLSRPLEDDFLDLSAWHLPPGFVVNFGNPHLVIFVPSAQDIPLETLGPLLSAHPAFPQKTNVEFVEVASDHLKMRVWERGVGVTPSCGSGACAAAAVALRRGLQKGPQVCVHLDGGLLEITAIPGQPLRQKGPVSFSFEGVWPL